MALPYASIPGATVPAATAGAARLPTNTGTPDGCATAQATGGFTTDGAHATAYGIDQAQAAATHVAVLIDGEGFLPDTYEAFATCFGVGLPTPQVHLVSTRRRRPSRSRSGRSTATCRPSWARRR